MNANTIPTIDLTNAVAIISEKMSKMKADRPRGLDDADLVGACNALTKAVETFHDDDTVGWQVTLWGGFLPNSYKWKAETDHLVIRIERTEGADVKVTQATLVRSQNCKRPKGKGSEKVVHVVKRGQTQGRVVEI